jgi:hypothetical protein
LKAVSFSCSSPWELHRSLADFLSENPDTAKMLAAMMQFDGRDAEGCEFEHEQGQDDGATPSAIGRDEDVGSSPTVSFSCSSPWELHRSLADFLSENPDTAKMLPARIGERERVRQQTNADQDIDPES